MTAKTLYIKDDYLQQILQGRKTIEVRVGYPNIARLAVGDRLMLNAQHSFIIRRVARYATFADLLANENPRVIAPDLSLEQLQVALRQIYPPDKEKLGVIAFEIAPYG